MEQQRGPRRGANSAQTVGDDARSTEAQPGPSARTTPYPGVAATHGGSAHYSPPLHGRRACLRRRRLVINEGGEAAARAIHALESTPMAPGSPPRPLVQAREAAPAREGQGARPTRATTEQQHGGRRGTHDRLFARRRAPEFIGEPPTGQKTEKHDAEQRPDGEKAKTINTTEAQVPGP